MRRALNGHSLFGCLKGGTLQFLKIWALTLLNACLLVFVFLPAQAFHKLAPQPARKK